MQELESVTNPVADPEVVETVTPEPLATPIGWHVATKDHPEHPPVWVDRVCTICGNTKPGQRQNFTQWYFPSKEKPPKETSIEVIDDKGETQTITLTEFRKARRALFTVRRGTVQSCGHKIDEVSGPKNNCIDCWFAYLNQHGELITALDEAFKEHGAEIIDRTRGVKFRKNFLKFMSAVANSVKEINVESTTGAGSVDQGTDHNSFTDASLVTEAA